MLFAATKVPPAAAAAGLLADANCARLMPRSGEEPLLGSHLAPPPVAPGAGAVAGGGDSCSSCVVPLCGLGFIFAAVFLLKHGLSVAQDGHPQTPNHSTIAPYVLGYQAAVLLLFGVFGLTMFPMAMLRLFKAHKATEPDLSAKALKVYRICGLWVSAAGLVSGALAVGGKWCADVDTVRWWACLGFAVVHRFESVSLQCWLSTHELQ